MEKSIDKKIQLGRFEYFQSEFDTYSLNVYLNSTDPLKSLTIKNNALIPK
jgi:hypothetical protein